MSARARWLLFMWTSCGVAAFAGGCSCGREAPSRGLAPEGASAEAALDDEGERYLGLTPTEAARVVARIGERTVTLRDIGDELAGESGPARARHALAEHRREILEIMIRRALLADEARRLGFQERESVRRAERTILAQLLGSMWHEDPTVVSEATSDEIAAWYEAHRDTFDIPVRRRARYLVAQDRQSALGAIVRLRQDPESSSLFRELSTSLAVEAPRYDAAGETSDFSEDQSDGTGVDPALRRAVFAASISEWIAEPVETDEGFLAVQVVTEQPAAHITLEQATDAVRAALRREAVVRAARRLVADRGDDVVVNQEALAAVRFPD